MKHFFISIIILTMLIIVGCSQKQDGLNGKNTVNNYNSSEEFYGEWLIKRDIPVGTVSIYSRTDIDSMIGKRITYSKDIAKYSNKKCEKPFYKKLTISQQEITYMLRTTYESIGIKEQSPPTMVEVYMDEQYSKSWGVIGDRFFIKDKNTLIIEKNGLFLELKRIK